MIAILAILSMIIIFYIIPAIICKLSAVHSLSESWALEDADEIMWIPAFNLIQSVVSAWYLLRIPKLLKEEYNKRKMCTDCGVVSYYGRTLIHGEFDGLKTQCPCCESTNYLYNTDKHVVVGTAMSAREAWQLHQSIKNYGNEKSKIKNTVYIDDQLAKYNAVQEAKLAKMKAKEEI